MQDGVKRSSACFTDEERAERVLNVFAGRSPCFTKKTHEERAERVLNVFAGRSPCFTRKTHEQRAKRGANAVCSTKRSGRPLVLQMKNERSEY